MIIKLKAQVIRSRECLDLLYNRITDEPWKYEDDEKQIAIFFDYYNRTVKENK